MDYIVVSTSKCNYQKWQIETLYWSIQKTQQKGKLIVLLSEDENHLNENCNIQLSGNVDIYHLPDWAKQWENTYKDWWGGIPNKYESIKWMCSNLKFKDTDRLLFLDPDMIFLEPVDLYPAENEVIGQEWKNFSKKSSDYSVVNRAIMYPFATRFSTLNKIVNDYRDKCIDLRIKTKRWEAEMFGLDYAFKVNDVNIKYKPNLGKCTVWESDDSSGLSSIIHYPNEITSKSGLKLFFKQDYTFDLDKNLEIKETRNTIDTFLLSNLDQKKTGYRYYLDLIDKDLFKFYTGENGYILYKQWSGGFNNIRMSYELAFAIAYITNRTLVLPQDSSYYLLKDYCNIDHFFNTHDTGIRVLTFRQFQTEEKILVPFESVKPLCKVITEEISNSILNFENLTPPSKVTKGRRVYNSSDLFSKSDRYVYFDKNLLGNYYSTLYSKKLDSVKQLINKYVRYRNDIFDLSWAYVNLLGDGEYYSLHLRRNDFQYRDLFIDSKELTDILLTHIPEKSKLYIATDLNDTKYFTPLKEKFQIFTFNDIKRELSHLTYDENWIPLIEQLICTRGKKFVGNKLSTLSSYIYRLRGLMKDINNKDYLINTEEYQKADQVFLAEDQKFIASWAREHKDAWYVDYSKIFVSIASYCDNDIFNTLENLYKYCSSTDRVNVCVNLQDTEYNYKKLLSFNYPNLNIIFTPIEEAKGVVVARNRIKKEVNGEPYFLQIDSHSRFKQNWDLILINQYNSIEEDKVILTTFPNHFDRPDKQEAYLELPYNAPLRIKRFLVSNSETDNRCIAENYPSHTSPEPFNTKWASAGFLFTRSNWVKEVTLPDNIRFNGEEDFQTFISFLKGWNLKVCAEACVWHNYNFKDSTTGEPYREHNSKYLIEDNSANLLNEALFSEGYVRSISDLEQYFEIKLRNAK